METETKKTKETKDITNYIDIILLIILIVLVLATRSSTIFNRHNYEIIEVCNGKPTNETINLILDDKGTPVDIMLNNKTESELGKYKIITNTK